MAAKAAGKQLLKWHKKARLLYTDGKGLRQS